MSATVEEFTQETFEEFEIVRTSGACNMLDRQCVSEVAESLDLMELEFATNDRKVYSRLLVAFSAWKTANA